MAANPTVLVMGVRRMAQDFGAGIMKLASAITTTSATTITVADYPSSLETGDILECDLEQFEITSETGTTMDVTRGERGTTATTHANEALVIIRPRFTNQAILDAINEGMEMLSQLHPNVVENTEVTTVANTEEYTVTDAVGVEGSLLDILRVEIETDTTNSLYRELPNWKATDTVPPKIIIRGYQPSGRTLKITTTRTWPQLVWSGASMPTGFQVKFDKFLVRFAAGVLLEQSEIRASGLEKAAVSQTQDIRTRYQQIGRNIQTAAFAYLDLITKSSSPIYRPSGRFYRL